MSDRKNINKYFPPDFDPSKVTKKKKDKNKKNVLQTVRLMTPFSMRCLSCGEYIASSKKFNAKKENTDEKYLQQKIFRFHIRCPMCNNEIIFRTDPKTSDFVMENGGVRNFTSSKPSSTITTTVAGAAAMENSNSGVGVETYDEILQRLEHEELLEKQALSNKSDLSRNEKIKELEEKLLQQEQESLINDELSNILARNKKINSQITIPKRNIDNNDDEELEKLAKQEFEKYRNLEKNNNVNDGTLSKPIEKLESTNTSISISSRNDNSNGNDNGNNNRATAGIVDYNSSSEDESTQESSIHMKPKFVKIGRRKTAGATGITAALKKRKIAYSS
ncbi:hypothetical protein PACTADRAFT_32666 [Pachysolen tannophilus NRRL Y-2460]|uniref:Splicing factor YJU2 n=1 Tax=Pachysolen tannophilus NRRL Y-2460 TaxID=669874 RepID=A0A1E4TZH8_PACTA|nr:hypothetical protein PACTADRAFT_32666 [Pachysolen tannophilus NRRL Y-2460]